MKISHEFLANIPEPASLARENASNPASLPIQSDPQAAPNATTGPTILDRVLDPLPGAAPGISDAADRAHSAVDSLSDMSDLDTLRLQQLMDNRNRFEEALSNIEKKQDDTASQILKNLKG